MATKEEKVKSFDDLSVDEELPVADAADEIPEEDQDEQEDASPAALFEAVLFLSSDPLPIQFFVKSFSMNETDVRIIL